MIEIVYVRERERTKIMEQKILAYLKEHEAEI